MPSRRCLHFSYYSTPRCYLSYIYPNTFAGFSSESPTSSGKLRLSAVLLLIPNHHELLISILLSRTESNRPTCQTQVSLVFHVLNVFFAPKDN